jgi:hypothetical protein
MYYLIFRTEPLQAEPLVFFLMICSMGGEGEHLTSQQDLQSTTPLEMEIKYDDPKVDL